MREIKDQGDKRYERKVVEKNALNKVIFGFCRLVDRLNAGNTCYHAN